MPAPVIRKPEVAIRGQIGRAGVIFDDNDVIRLLRAAVEREGSQTAFARRHGIERTTIKAILSGKRPVTESVANALGLRRTYTAMSATLCPPAASRRRGLSIIRLALAADVLTAFRRRCLSTVVIPDRID